ncbi:MAG: putative 4-hydroxybenzoate polyprenyltransferase [Phycisphaerales bacterium]|nr:putative 4-hydroxybenzoate polyprenyltransferase [Phycisphaerales bacterium]MCI0630741.1 putative 4-hydroxybenzoate polyprenyltransferase [Phycisphaerales bacterium]MCI0676571.1 putative 4-hydroxybenzoate polyprenyltransferase [Phycisphaerales bacterium]
MSLAPPIELKSSPLRTARVIAGDIKIAHSVFALPFALLAAFMAAVGESQALVAWKRFGQQLALIVLAMVFARTTAMLANRLLDRQIDAANPRTANRALPSERLSVTSALGGIATAVACFLLVCALFGWLFENWWPLVLGPAVLAWISAYPLLKRFTAMCHLYLGSSLAISPLAAAIAIDPASLGNQPSLWLLSAMVLCWVAGFDIIYALQDVEIDRAQGLHSIPSRLGLQHARWISRGLHALALASLVASLLVDPRLGALFGLGVLVVAALLIYEHATVARWGTTKIALAFFTLNGMISCVLGALGVADLLV